MLTFLIGFIVLVIYRSLIDGGLSHETTLLAGPRIIRRADVASLAKTSMSQTTLNSHLRTGFSKSLSCLYPCTRCVASSSCSPLSFNLYCSFVLSNTHPPSSLLCTCFMYSSITYSQSNIIWTPWWASATSGVAFRLSFVLCMKSIGFLCHFWVISKWFLSGF